jgi:hypothetical protein
MVIAHHPDR